MLVKVTHDRKRDVMLLVAFGRPPSATAAYLGVSERTLGKYFRHELRHGCETLLVEVVSLLQRSADRGSSITEAMGRAARRSPIVARNHRWSAPCQSGMT